MRKASGPKSHRPNWLRINTRSLLPECADGTCAIEENARDINIVPMHRRGFAWWNIEKIDRESVGAKEFSALWNLCIRYGCFLSGRSATAHNAYRKAT